MKKDIIFVKQKFPDAGCEKDGKNHTVTDGDIALGSGNSYAAAWRAARNKIEANFTPAFNVWRARYGNFSNERLAELMEAKLRTSTDPLERYTTNMRIKFLKQKTQFV